MIVERREDQLKARIYPVTRQAGMDFYDRDGKTKSRITLADPDWEAPEVTDETTGKQIQGRWSQHAYEFPLVPGHDYRVE